MIDLRKYVVAVSRIVVNHDGKGSKALDASGILKNHAKVLRVTLNFTSHAEAMVCGIVLSLFALAC